MNDSEDEVAWNQIVAEEQSYIKAAFPLLARIHNIDQILVQALERPDHRGTALRLLLIVVAEDLKKRVFPELVALASVGHADIELCRKVILTIERPWVLKHLDQYMQPILLGGGDEEFRRLAELLERLEGHGGMMLACLVELALVNKDPHVHEVGEDFSMRIKKSSSPN